MLSDDTINRVKMYAYSVRVNVEILKIVNIDEAYEASKEVVKVFADDDPQDYEKLILIVAEVLGV